jgi:cell division protein FtsZ
MIMSFDLFETNNEVKNEPTNESTNLSSVESNEIQLNSENEGTYESTNQVELSEPVLETKPEFTWDVIDSPIENENLEEIKNEARPFTLFDNPVTPEPTKVEVVRHMLEDDTHEKLNLEQTKKVLSPEEQQRKAQERVSKIQEYTAKLKKAEGIAEFENEPAFVRRNINLNNSTPSSEESFSRFGLSSDSEGNSGLRNNNFLHDNVD